MPLHDNGPEHEPADIHDDYLDLDAVIVDHVSGSLLEHLRRVNDIASHLNVVHIDLDQHLVDEHHQHDGRSA